MFSLLGDTAVDTMIQFFESLLGGITLDVLLYIFIGIMAALFIAGIVRLIWCYESRAMRQMRRINKYLKDNPRVNDENLVDFHNKMKKLPRRIRDRWQLFMLEREGSPSRYMTVEYCVKRPLYNSAILMVKKQMGYATLIVSLLALVLSMSLLVLASGTTAITLLLVLQALIIPFVCSLFGCVFCMVLHLRYTSVNNNLYDMFTVFVRNIDKATNSMPDYVDYELLFTKKEIDAGIPVLREYLEKRAMEEQRLLEKAKQEEANHSPYNFADLGVNGEQLIERAVTESEKFLMQKLQTQQEITDLEKQLQKTEANMEDIEREANRKLQAIKENLERLDKAMAETTNRVEINYNRRQATDEMNKKAKLEKDMENMLAKERVAADALKVEIQKRKEIIEENKKDVETALKSEYDTFATKVYQELNKKVTRDNSEQMHEMEMVIARLKAKVKEFNRDIEKRDNLVEARNIELDNLRQQLNRGKPKKRRERDLERSTPAKVLDENIVSAETLNTEVENINYAPVVENAEVYQEPIVQEFVEPVMQEQVYFEQNPEQQPMYEQGFEQQVFEQMPDQNYDAYAQQPVFEQPIIEQNDTIYQDQFVEEFAQQPPVQETTTDTVQEPVEEVKEEKKSKSGQVKKTASKIKPAKKVGAKEVKEVVADEVVEEKVEPKEEVKTEEDKAKEAELAKQKEQEEEFKKELTEKVEKLNAELEKVKAEKEKEKEEKAKEEIKEEKKYVENEDLVAIQQQIEAENERLKKQQEELRAQIDKTLKTMENAANASKAERTRNIKKIKELIAQLKQEAEDAKARGASKAEINKINKSAAELVKVIAEYQANQPK